eukprot:TRINITY_DN2647_c0_g1_i1.p1 TRINITY_DN2647_c0_g1~~TRINITY_DN2647_c0_g1_i1.p1  ORF type:complete len:176 (-),score=27.17 TRINITY_DN2647_c0_g1_i1:194-721(-)
MGGRHGCRVFVDGLCAVVIQEVHGSCQFLFFFFFSSRRRHTRCREVSWARRCVQETGINAEYMGYRKIKYECQTHFHQDGTFFHERYKKTSRTSGKISTFFQTIHKVIILITYSLFVKKTPLLQMLSSNLALSNVFALSGFSSSLLGELLEAEEEDSILGVQIPQQYSDGTNLKI